MEKINTFELLKMIASLAIILMVLKVILIKYQIRRWCFSKDFVKFMERRGWEKIAEEIHMYKRGYFFLVFIPELNYWIVRSMKDMSFISAGQSLDLDTVEGYQHNIRKKYISKSDILKLETDLERHISSN